MLLLGTLLGGCALWQPDWQVAAPTGTPGQVEGLRQRAQELSDQAGDRAALEMAIDAWDAVLAASPADSDALIELANQQILYGAAYAEGRAARKRAYRRAMSLSALAMGTNPAFRGRVETGDALWEAVDALTARELDAMGFWTTALFYYYKDGQGPIGQVVNFRWMQRARRVLERMTELDPEWGGGMLHFLWGIYYLAIPEAVGGDRERAALYFAQAVAAGPDWLQHRWGRGRYYHVKMGNRAACREDLEWVAAQDLSQAAGPYAWRAYIQRDARNMLADLGRYF